MNTMRREHIEDLIAKEVETIIAGSDIELVDVEYVRERDWYLRVFIDKEGGVDLEDCQAVSEKLSQVLDEKDPIRENYLLEVSSPGLDRILRKDKDFIRYAGRSVDIHFFKAWNGVKDVTAELVKKTADDKLVVLIDGEEHEIDRKEISQVRLHIDF